MECPNCGADLDFEDVVCERCGFKLRDDGSDNGDLEFDE